MWDVKGLTSEWKKIVSKYKYVLLLVGVGVLFLLWPSGPSGEQTKTSFSEPGVEEFSVSGMEAKIAQVLSQAEGVGQVRVALTLKTGLEMVVSKDTQSSQHRELDDSELRSYDLETSDKTVLVQGSNGGTQPVVSKRIYPEYLGALIVCEGAQDATTRLWIVNAVSSLTGLGSDRITVVPMKKE